MSIPDRYAPVFKFLAVVKGKYKLPILIYLKHGPKRYSQLHRRLAGVSERMLVKQLRELEQAGILQKTVTGTKAPLRVEYALTAHGFTPINDPFQETLQHSHLAFFFLLRG